MKKNGILWQIFNLFKTTDSTPTTPATPTAPAQKTPRSKQKTETHKVAGVSFRQGAIMSIAEENADYSMTKRKLIAEDLTDEWIYEYEFYPHQVELVPEPDNPKDSKAIKVVVDRQHIGYIKAGSCAHIHNLIKDDKILKLTCEIKGGRRKMVQEDVDEWGKSSYSVETDSIPFYATLSIVVSLE